MRPRQDGRHFQNERHFQKHFSKKNMQISISLKIKISLKFLPKGAATSRFLIPMMVTLLTQICFIRPKWVKNSIDVLPGGGDYLIFLAVIEKHASHDNTKVLSTKMFPSEVIHFKHIPDYAITNMPNNSKPVILWQRCAPVRFISN